MRPVLKSATVMVLVLVIGLHWALLQTVAWTGMIVTYSQDSSFTEALAKTFDGRHPCCLCKAVSAGKKSEQKTEFTITAFKPEFPLNRENSLLIAPSQYQLCPQPAFFAKTLSQPPPTPPPRGLFA